MSTTTVSPSPLEINALADAADLARELQTPFNEDDIKEFAAFGIDLQLAARAFVFEADAVDNNGFIRKLNRYVREGRDLSVRQTRAALNIMREHLLGLPPDRNYDEDLTLDPSLGGRFRCVTCGHISDHRADAIEHRMEAHGYVPAQGTIDKAIVDPESVLEVQIETGVDISELRDGFYAVPDKRYDTQSQGGWRYLRVRRTSRDKELRNRRYQYGKKIKGAELIPAGTIEVRNMVGDTRELVGEQRPGGTYKGKYEDLLVKIMKEQQFFAELYAQMMERCGVCGKKLTDAISQADLMGPECVKKYPDYWSAPPTKYRGPATPTEPVASSA